MKKQSFFLFLIFVLSACASPQVRPAQATPADVNASESARVVQAYLADLTNDVQPGVIAGQNTGHGDQILNLSGTVGYTPLVAALEQQTGELPGVLGLDYEHDQIFSTEALLAANQLLIRHWQKGGLVTINWSPLNPWLNDELDLVKHPGIWSDTRNVDANLKGVDLTLLLDPTSTVYPIWRRKLDRVATALENLQQAGVVVLWRPMQEMNGNWFWWGHATYGNDPAPYIALWRDMFHYFTIEKGLHNLLWVYSPCTVSGNVFEQAAVKPVGWSYPGDAYVDVVAGTSYNDGLEIKNYDVYRTFGKPLGMAEFGPTIGGEPSLKGTFNTKRYADRLLKDYAAIAYWVSWHNWVVSENVQEHQAIISHQYVQDLMQNPLVLTLKRIQR